MSADNEDKLQKFESREYIMLKLFPWLRNDNGVPTPEMLYDFARWMSAHLLNGKEK